LGHFEALFALNLSLTIFTPCELLATALQSPKYTASGAQKSASILWDMLQRMGDSDFENLWEKTTVTGEKLKLKPPKLEEPRLAPPPKRFEQTSKAAPPTRLDSKQLLKKNLSQSSIY